MAKKEINIRAKLRWGIVGIFALLIIAVSYDVPQLLNRGIAFANNTLALGIPQVSEDGFNLGLDLQGGAHLIYRADVSRIEEVERAEAVDGVRDVIERRVNGLGVGEPNIQTARVAGEYRINVELPGVEDVNNAISLIGETPILEFQVQNDEPPRELTAEEEAQIEEANTEAQARAQEALSKLRAGAVFEDVVAEFSQDELTVNNGGYIGFIRSQDTIASALYDWAQTATEGDTSRTVIESDIAYHVLKRGIERDGEPQANARHILVCFLGARNCHSPLYTKDEARTKAQELFDQATAQNFAQLARENSTDFVTSEDGGQLPPFTNGGFIPELDQIVFDAQDGEIIGPIETPLGFHVVYKEGTSTAKEYELSHVGLTKTRDIDILPPNSEWKPTGLSGKQLERAEVVSDPNTGSIQVSLQFDREGTDLFEQLTRDNIGRPIAIFLDGQPISIPTVQTVISGGTAVITGNFSVTEARELAQRLNTGALPVPVELISQQSVGASLGAESLALSLKAGMAGIMLVMLFMLIYYRFPGVLAVISLSVYISVTLALFKLIGVTLSLAGIAGFILSIGMAVDANVLIFERLKEELRDGKSLKAAVEEGFLRAWTSIRDGNVSTLITCALLIWFGSSFVQGFALTLAIGIGMSMFSAITITRVMLRFVVPWFGRYGNKMFLGANKQDQ